MRDAALAIFLAISPVLLACGQPAEHGDETFFPKDLKQGGYAQVRACRYPGEHSGLGAFTVWVNAGARASFDAIWADPPQATQMQAGSIVVKEIYTTTTCAADQIDHWVAMKKEPGFDAAHGDWRWQEVESDGTITVNGKSAECSDCHEGRADTSCTGYGALNGKDYLCTVP